MKDIDVVETLTVDGFEEILRDPGDMQVLVAKEGWESGRLWQIAQLPENDFPASTAGALRLRNKHLVFDIGAIAKVFLPRPSHLLVVTDTRRSMAILLRALQQGLVRVTVMTGESPTAVTEAIDCLTSSCKHRDS
jgi:hypothetical protein